MYTPCRAPKFERLRRRQADETMDPDQLTAIRKWALATAIDQVPSGTVWEVIFALAAKFEKYIIQGKWDTPIADSKKEEV